MPINKNDKVDMLIQQMKENSILMDLDADNAIRIAIKKMSVQIYFVNNYSFNRKKELKVGEKKVIKQKKTQKSKEDVLNSVPSIIKTFGTKYNAINKQEKEALKKKRRPHKGEYTTTTENSIHPIYIAAGGLNKRY